MRARVARDSSAAAVASARNDIIRDVLKKTKKFTDSRMTGRERVADDLTFDPKGKRGAEIYAWPLA